MAGLVALVFVVGLLGFLFFVVYTAMHEDKPAKPQRIGRRDAKEILAENKALRNVLNDIDTDARVESQVNSGNLFAHLVVTKISKYRRELD